MDSSTVCSKAADVLREQGWGQRAFRPPGGGYCVLGALNVAAGLVYDDPGGLYELPFLAEMPDAHLLLARWNDETGRTQDEVLEALEHFANGGSLDDILPPAHADT